METKKKVSCGKIQIRIKEEDLVALEQKLIPFNGNFTKFVKHHIHNLTEEDYNLKLKLLESRTKYLVELHKIGTNINQIARVLNTYGNDNHKVNVDKMTNDLAIMTDELSQMKNKIMQYDN